MWRRMRSFLSRRWRPAFSLLVARQPAEAGTPAAFLLAYCPLVLFNQPRRIRVTAFWRPAMKRLCIPVILVLLLAFGLSAPLPGGGGEKPPDGFESLFNGKDLTGWKSTG